MDLNHACAKFNNSEISTKIKSDIRLFDMMTEIRDVTVNLLHVLSAWRSSSFEWDPNDPKPFMYKGENYILKIVYDLNFLADTPYVIKVLNMERDRLLQNPLMLKNTLFEAVGSPNPIERAVQDTNGINEGPWYDQRCKLRIAEQILLQELHCNVLRKQNMKQTFETDSGELKDEIGTSSQQLKNPETKKSPTRKSPTSFSELPIEKQSILSWQDQAHMQLSRIDYLRNEPLISASTDRLSPVLKEEEVSGVISPKRNYLPKQTVLPTKLTSLDTLGSTRDLLQVIKRNSPSSSPTAGGGTGLMKLTALDGDRLDSRDKTTRNSSSRQRYSDSGNVEESNVFHQDYTSKTFGVEYTDLIGASKIRKVNPSNVILQPIRKSVQVIERDIHGIPIKKKDPVKKKKFIKKSSSKPNTVSKPEDAVLEKFERGLKSEPSLLQASDAFPQNSMVTDDGMNLVSGGRSIADMISQDDINYFVQNYGSAPPDLQLCGAAVIILLSTHTEIPADISWDAFIEICTVTNVAALMAQLNPMQHVPAFKVRALLPFLRRLGRSLKYRVAAVVKQDEANGYNIHEVSTPEIRLLEWIIHVRINLFVYDNISILCLFVYLGCGGCEYSGG